MKNKATIKANEDGSITLSVRHGSKLRQWTVENNEKDAEIREYLGYLMGGLKPEVANNG